MTRNTLSRIRQIVNRIEAVTDERGIYAGRSSTGTHYFAGAYIKGDAAALEYVRSLARVAGIEP